MINLSFTWFCHDFFTGGTWKREHFSKVTVGSNHYSGRTLEYAEECRKATMLEF